MKKENKNETPLTTCTLNNILNTIRTDRPDAFVR